METIKFIASLPPIASAVTIGGERETRIKLDVPATELSQVLKLIELYAGRAFRVTVEPDE